MPWRRAVLPDEVRRALPLERGERPIATAAVAGGGWAVATDLALHLPGPDPRAGGYSRRPWHVVVHVVWDDERATLTVEEGVPGAGIVRHRLRLTDPGYLPETVRERVVASIVLSARVPLRGRLGVRVVARRVPDGQDLTWQVVPDDAIDLTDPEIRARVDAAVAELRTQT